MIVLHVRRVKLVNYISDYLIFSVSWECCVLAGPDINNDKYRAGDQVMT